MALDGNHVVGSGGHVDDHNLIDAALSNIPKVVTGSYTGDASANRVIALGFTPKWLQVSGGNTYALAPGPNGNFGIRLISNTAVASYNSSSGSYPAITTNGFFAGSSMNASGTAYDYLAIG